MRWSPVTIEGKTLHRQIRITAAVAAVAAASLIVASAASAATAAGNTCTGDRAEPTPATLVQLSSTSDPASVTVPVSGVITKWGVNVISYPGGISEKLKVLRPAGGHSFTTVGESTVQPIAGGSNSFETRIPVQAGDHLGAFSPLETIFCEESSAPTDVLGILAGDTPLGSTGIFAEEPMGQLAVSATVEPDADGDGVGDETQDKCPQSAAVQVACPTVTLSASASVKKSSTSVLVTDNVQSSVTVAGSVKLGKGKSAKLSGGTQVVAPGAFAKFTLPFSGKLKSALQKLSRKQSLTLTLSATAPNLVGAPSSKTLKVKLKGQAKPKKG
jgi:hypothetical protein